MSVLYPGQIGETRVLYCVFDKAEQTYRRILRSRPVFVCTGPCGRTREIEILGGASAPPKLATVLARPPIFSPPAAAGIRAVSLAGLTSRPDPASRTTSTARIYRRKAKVQQYQENRNMKKNPLQQAIDKAVAEAVEPLEARIRELEAQRDQPDIQDLVAAELLRQLGLEAGQRKEPAKGAVAEPRRKRKLELPPNFKCVRTVKHLKCPSAWCIKAYNAEQP